jgi:hypothetical protein
MKHDEEVFSVRGPRQRAFGPDSRRRDGSNVRRRRASGSPGVYADPVDMGLILARRFFVRAEPEEHRQRFFGRGRKHVAILSSKDDELTEVRP